MQTFEEFTGAYPARVFEKGQVILFKDEIPKGAYIIESGLIKTYTIGESGDERIISIDAKGEDIPIGFTAGLINRAQYFYEAYSKCVVRVIPTQAYMKHLTENNESLIKRHIRITKLLLSTQSRVETLEYPKASDKVARTLLYMADRIGVRSSTKNAYFKLSITQQEIANTLGLTRETASQVLKKLEVKKLLVHSRNNYTLYVERLRKYIDRS